MPCAAQNTVNSNSTGTKAGRLWYQVQFGLPPMSIGQSLIMKYHVPNEAREVPVIPNMKEAMPIRVRFKPMIGSRPWMGKGLNTSFTVTPAVISLRAALLSRSGSSYTA